MTLLWREVVTADYMAAVAARGGYEMTDDPKGPVEDDLEDPAKQDPSPDLPSPVEGNDDEDDTDDEPDESHIKQDQQTG